MREVIRQVRTGLLMRVDSYKKIKNCYKTKTLTFGCAANWIDYALKKNNEAIGDIFECIFAHLPINDNRIYVCDKNGRPIGENLWILCDENSQTCFLRFIPAILTPLICFYNVLPQKELVDNEYEIIDLDKYKTAMGYIKDTVGYLIIDDIKSFYIDLKDAILLAVNNNRDNLTSERFYTKFNANKPVTGKNICYEKYTRDSIFYNRQEGLEEIFWKLPEYSWQNEVRFAIPNINFIQSYNMDDNYNFVKNQIKIHLPNFHKYTKIYSSDKIHTLYYTNNGYQVCVNTINDIKQQKKSGKKLILNCGD